jgi:hypothetical protein
VAGVFGALVREFISVALKTWCFLGSCTDACSVVHCGSVLVVGRTPVVWQHTTYLTMFL